MNRRVTASAPAAGSGRQPEPRTATVSAVAIIGIGLLLVAGALLALRDRGERQGPSARQATDPPAAAFDDDALTKAGAGQIGESEMGGAGPFASIGARPRRRTGGQAVIDGQRWLIRQQDQRTGLWAPVGIHGGAEEDAAITMTGLVLLGFLDAGSTQRRGPYQVEIGKGIDALLGRQRSDGTFAASCQAHALATAAIIGAFEDARTPALRQASARAVAAILDREIRDESSARLAWPSSMAHPDRVGSSTSFWNVMALKRAYAVEIDGARDGLAGVKRWLERAWSDDATPPQHVGGGGGSAARSDPSRVVVDADAIAFGLAMAVELGYEAGDPRLDAMADQVLRQRAIGAVADQPAMTWIITRSLFRIGGPAWEGWAATTIGALLAAQRVGDGSLAGSWDGVVDVAASHAEEARLERTGFAVLTVLDASFPFMTVEQPPR